MGNLGDGHFTVSGIRVPSGKSSLYALEQTPAGEVHRPDASGESSLHVVLGVADHDGPIGIERPLGEGSLDESRRGLAAVAYASILADSLSRVMRTVICPVDVRAARG